MKDSIVNEIMEATDEAFLFALQKVLERHDATYFVVNNGETISDVLRRGNALLPKNNGDNRSYTIEAWDLLCELNEFIKI